MGELDWIYDEVHLCESGNVEHVIEFVASVMRIECADLSYSTIERTETGSLGAGELGRPE
jgi:hypothetical protein